MRDLQRKPLDAFLMGLCLMSIIAMAAIGPLFSHALEHTLERILADGPSLIVRKISAGGWQPIPIKQALQAARSVPGVVEARPRIWGTVAGPDGPTTVVAIDENVEKKLEGIEIPPIGEAVVGPMLKSYRKGEGLLLVGANTLTLEVSGFLDAKHSMVAHDLVLVRLQDARKLLDIPEGFASDLAIDVFHEDEAEAMRADLTRAFPWPVRITTKNRYLGPLCLHTGSWERTTSLDVTACTAGPCRIVPRSHALTVAQAFGNGVAQSFGMDRKRPVSPALGQSNGDSPSCRIVRCAFGVSFGIFSRNRVAGNMVVRLDIAPSGVHARPLRRLSGAAGSHRRCCNSLACSLVIASDMGGNR